MDKTLHYESYVQILKEELIPAMGCTEPIAVALAAAKAREAMGAMPEKTRLEVSGNIIKNVKAVTVPNTGGLKGLEAATAAGIVAGREDLDLEVLSKVTPEQIQEMKAYLDSHEIKVVPYLGDRVFYINVEVSGGGHTASCEIMDYHTNVTRIQVDDKVLYQAQGSAGTAKKTDRSVLNVKEILAFADTVDIADVEEVIRRQIAYNTAISKAGLEEKWGAQVGKHLLETYGDSLPVRAAAAAAAGSDARMSGCELPVVIVSGSGNQGMTTSLPVIEYAKAMGVSEEKMIRALVAADLITIHQKTSIGTLSAFCGAVSAGTGAACGIAYLKGASYEAIAQTITNALGTCSGMVCDGAKPSCAAKIAAAVQAGLLGYDMYVNGGDGFCDGEGIVKEDVEKTIASVGRMAREGMRRTDEVLLDIMVGE